MNYLQREELARKIGMFLVGKGLNTGGVYRGRLTKKEQIDAFGFYMGKGMIEVNGACDVISMDVKVNFGQEFDTVCTISARFREWPYASDSRGISQFIDYCNTNRIEVH